MLLKALDLLRTLGWYVVHFIYDLIDSLFDILKGLNSFDIISSISDTVRAAGRVSNAFKNI